MLKRQLKAVETYDPQPNNFVVFKVYFQKSSQRGPHARGSVRGRRATHSDTAPHPLGPWTAPTQIGAYANGSSVTQAQQRSVFAYPHAAAEPVWVWMGNRWQSAPDGVKDHDFETWLPIEFAPQAGETPPLPKPMVWQDSWSLGPA